MAGYSGKPLAQKLGIKPGFCIFVSGAPASYADIVGALPEGATLAAALKRYRAAIAPHGMVWVSWPKKASGVATDLSDLVVRATALPLGLVDVKVCAIDATWSGLKFVIPKDQRG